MSKDIYFARGYTPAFRFLSISSVSTVAVWTPTTSTRIVLTDLVVSSNLGGTILFSLGNLAGSRIFEFFVGSSATISPMIGSIESTMYDRAIFASTSQSGSEGWKVTLMGFEGD